MRRQRRQKLTDTQIADKLKPKRYFHPDPELVPMRTPMVC
jgi:hypothetical protein